MISSQYRSIMQDLLRKRCHERRTHYSRKNGKPYHISYEDVSDLTNDELKELTDSLWAGTHFSYKEVVTVAEIIHVKERVILLGIVHAPKTPNKQS